MSNYVFVHCCIDSSVLSACLRPSVFAMKEIAFFLLPLGGILSFLLCVPIQCVQRACISFASLQLSLGRVSLRLSATCFLYSLLRFVHVCTRVARDASPQSAGLGAPGASHPNAGAGLALDVRRQAQVLRHQRNFWITLSAVFVWLFVWWLAKLLRWYWRSLAAKQKEVETLRAQVALFTRRNLSAPLAENGSETAKKSEETAKKSEETAKKSEETAKKGKEKRGDAERDGETLEKNSKVQEVELTALERQKADGCREEKNEAKERAGSNETRQRLLYRENADARTLGVID
ncbi:B-cell receptor-associated 31-like protein [Toxoplasma gondii ARI]|uniref:B-cell receptor-associated 31-like protein n=1 Tax=Toxoplasma gondii ARI TaxID=1074872 RepID=A0A139XJ63_TOXGO|nr:B-cell receptor-associated 31-like protein [Toxoplasma gondii ARI]